jgi:hypothetical protein
MTNRKITPKQNGPQSQIIHQACTASGGPVGGSGIAGLFILSYAESISSAVNGCLLAHTKDTSVLLN